VWPKAHGRILVVDDEDVVVDILQTALSERGFAIDCAATGEQAYQMAGSNRYDLIISDIRMPGSMDGRRLYLELREEKPEMAERFIFISGDVMEKKTAEFLNTSGRAYLLKPFSLNDLHEVVEKTLRQARS
jgi:two-component system NtrC family sensor kinase